MKKYFAIVLALTLCVSLLAGCGGNQDKDTTKDNDTTNTTGTTAPENSTPDTTAPDTGDTTDTGDTAEPSDTGDIGDATDTATDPKADLSPAEKIVDSYYGYSYDAGGMIMTYFFHFYPEIQGLGAVYYAGFAMNQITFSGTYEVVEQETEYACWPSREAVTSAGEGATPPVGTAPYAINFYDMDGNLVDTCAFDGDNLYEDMEAITGIGGGNAVYARDVDPETSALKSDYDGEIATPLLSLIDPNDETATLDLLVNGKYNDAVIMFVDGTYSMNEDQSEITLTPSSESDNGATVTKNEDGTYTYTSTDGTEVIMNVVGAAKNIAYLYKGEIAVPGADVMGDLICELYDDGTARIYASAFGSELDIDTADSYDIDMESYVITVHFNTAGDIATAPYGVSMDYAATGIEVFGDVNTTLNMVTE